MKIAEKSYSSQRFSKGLETRLIEYFKKEYALNITDEEAQLFLRSLATVYDALSREPKSDTV